MKLYKIFLPIFFFGAFLNWMEIGTTKPGNVDGEGIYKIPIRRHIIQRKRANAGNNLLALSSNADIIHDYFNMLYTTTINMGNPPQDFDVILDTGSSTFWLIAPECCGDPQYRAQCPAKCDRINKNDNHECNEKCPKKFFYNESSSYEATIGNFAVKYEDKSNCSGFVGKDVLRFGPINEKSAVAIPGTFIGLANQIDTGSEYDTHFDGLIGLAFTTISNNDPQVDPPLIDAMKRGMLKENVFTVHLKTESASAAGDNEIIDHGGEFTIGSIDTENCGQILGWVDLTEATEWRFNVDRISHNGQGIQTSTVSAISDTGTALIWGPNFIVQRIYEKIGKIYAKKIGDSTIHYIPCNHDYEPILFNIGGEEYSLTKEVLTIPVDGENCVFGIMPGKINDKNVEWILGTPFIRQFCHIYDIGKERIGFAEIKRK